MKSSRKSKEINANSETLFADNGETREIFYENERILVKEVDINAWWGSKSSLIWCFAKVFESVDHSSRFIGCCRCAYLSKSPMTFDFTDKFSNFKCHLATHFKHCNIPLFQDKTKESEIEEEKIDLVFKILKSGLPYSSFVVRNNKADEKGKFPGVCAITAHEFKQMAKGQMKATLDNIMNELKNIVIHLSFDSTTNNGIHYIDFIGYYISNDSEFQTVRLGCLEAPDTLNTLNYQKCIKDLLGRFSIAIAEKSGSQSIENSCILLSVVTDAGGAGMPAAISLVGKDYHTSCMAHAINNLINDIFCHDDFSYLFERIERNIMIARKVRKKELNNLSLPDTKISNRWGRIVPFISFFITHWKIVSNTPFDWESSDVVKLEALQAVIEPLHKILMISQAVVPCGGVILIRELIIALEIYEKQNFLVSVNGRKVHWKQGDQAIVHEIDSYNVIKFIESRIKHRFFGIPILGDKTKTENLLNNSIILALFSLSPWFDFKFIPTSIGVPGELEKKGLDSYEKIYKMFNGDNNFESEAFLYLAAIDYSILFYELFLLS